MSGSIAAKAERGARELVDRAESMLQQSIAAADPRVRFVFPSTVYYLPIVLGQSAKAVERVGDLQPILRQARGILTAEAAGTDDAIDVGLASLLAAEIIETLSSLEPLGSKSDAAGACVNSPISDLEVRTWGIQLADGRVPAIALLVGCAKNTAVAAQLVKELRRHNVLCLVAGNAQGLSLVSQLNAASIALGDRASIIPLGVAPTSAVHALGFVARCAMKLGGHKPGMWPQILQHSKRRTPGFTLALGELDDASIAVVLAAQGFGFPIILDTAVPDGDRLISLPFETLEGTDDIQKAQTLVEKCIAARGLELKTSDISVPVAYGPTFEDEVICSGGLYVQLGGEGSHGFELLQSAHADEITDGKVEIVGPDLPGYAQSVPMNLGIVARVAGPRMQADFEPFLERQMHTFISYASGIQHIGRQDAMAIRVSNEAADQGFRLDSIGRILHTRFHEEFGGAIDKVEIMLITDPKQHAAWREKARGTHDLRAQRLASLTDSQVDEFYVCTRCRSFAPNNVSIISPERVSPCGQCNWLDAAAAYALNPGGQRRPIKLGKPIDTRRGVWEGTNNYARAASHGRINEVSLYSIMDNPMVACGDFECIVMLIPEANGVMVVAHEDTSLTPAGITIETFSSITAGEQIPGVIGIGKSYLLSPKFILAEGGFKRVVWMSSVLKETMSDDLKAVCAREGDPDLLDKIADERQATSVEQLVNWLKTHKHPALAMERMF